MKKPCRLRINVIHFLWEVALFSCVLAINEDVTVCPEQQAFSKIAYTSDSSSGLRATYTMADIQTAKRLHVQLQSFQAHTHTNTESYVNIIWYTQMARNVCPTRFRYMGRTILFFGGFKQQHDNKLSILRAARCHAKYCLLHMYISTGAGEKHDETKTKGTSLGERETDLNR